MSRTPAAQDRAFVARAIALAEAGRDRTRPNPLVGCVLVRDGEIVGEGWHAAVGELHAEAVALDAAGAAARGATAYISLEPCAHRGRTPPCVKALIAAGIDRVVYGLADPNPVASGGHAELESAGVAVTGGVLAPWVAAQNEAFVTAATRRRPHVTLKLAQTLDGALELMGDGWITGPVARAAVHRLRAHADGVLVGSGTVLSDDPRLTVRHVDPAGAQPRAVVLDGRGRVPVAATVAREGTIVVTTRRSDEAWRDRLAETGCEVVVVPGALGGGVSLPHALEAVLERGVQALLAEPGATLAGALVAEGLVDRLVVHIAVRRVGADGRPRLARCTTAAATCWRTRAAGAAGTDHELVARPVAA